VLDLLIADIAKDGKILQIARESAKALLEDDPELSKEENKNIRNHIATLRKDAVNWSRIS